MLGDVKRLERVPFSVHEKTGDLCCPVDLNGTPLTVESLKPYRERGLDSSLIESVCKEIVAEEKWREIASKKRRSIIFEKSGVRPCIEHALTLPLHKGEGHLMRLAIAAEYLNNGIPVSQVAELFRGQTDFGNGGTTLYYAKDIQRKGYKPFKCKTIRELDFCLGEECSIYKKKGGKL